MSYTVQQVVTRALKLLHVLQGGEVAQNEDAVVGLENYNAMMFGFEASGLSLHDVDDDAYTHATQALSGTFPLADKHFEGIAAILASRMAPEFPADPDVRLENLAREGMSRMYGDFFDVSEMTVGRTLRQLPSQTAGDFGE